MPLHFCHPNTPHRKLGVPEWFVSNLMMDRALDAVVRRAKMLDRKHDIPYLAGYSKDGKTIYIDRHMPSSFRYDGRDIDTDRYLILHEDPPSRPAAKRGGSYSLVGRARGERQQPDSERFRFIPRT
jgi:hypothetical protein